MARPQRMKKVRYVNFKIDKEDWDRFSNIALEKKRYNVSDLTREVIINYCDEYDRQKNGK